MAEKLHLRVLQTTDLHGHLRPYDYVLDQAAPDTGLAALGPLIDAARSEEPNCLLFDCGDLIQGTPLADLASDISSGHPAVAALEALGFDVITPGNHDLDFGWDPLLAAFGAAQIPVLSANLLDDADAPVFQPSAMLTRQFADTDGKMHSLNIGVFGVLPPQTASWNGHHLAGRGSVSDAFQAARDTAAALRRAGADLIIALAHSGLGDGSAPAFAENIAWAMSDRTEADIVLAAHTHQLEPGELTSDRALPILQAGAMASHLGVMDLVVERGPDGWRIARITRRLLPPRADTSPHPAVMAATEAAHHTTLAHVRRPIGETTVPLNSYFNLIGHDAGAGLTAAAALAFAADLSGGRPCLAAVAPFRAGGTMGPDYFTDVPAGPMALRHAAELYLYPNEVRLIEVTGAILRDWLDHAAGLYHQILPSDRPTPLIVPGRPTYNADAIWGLRYQIDLSQPARFDEDGQQISDTRRIRDLRHGDAHVQDDDVFVVVTNSYRASGGGGFRALAACPVLDTAPDIMRDILARHIEAEGKVAPDPTLPFRFAPLGGQAVWFDTGPGAERHLASLPDGFARPLGITDTGFLRLQLSL